MFLKSLTKFWESESGAVTVDWVVLTAAIVGMGIAVLFVIVPGLNPMANSVEPVMLAAPGVGAGLIGAGS